MKFYENFDFKKKKNLALKKNYFIILKFFENFEIL